MAKIIELKNVYKTYYKKKIATPVLFDLNVAFKKASFTSIIGESGSGKSTLLNILGTLDKPTKGEVFIDNIKISEINKNELARLRNQTVGFIFQFHYLLPEFTVLENVLMPKMISQRITGKDYKKAKEFLELVGLLKKANSLSTNISGGEQQRTAVARALMNNPKIILADEPTGNLDSKTTEKVYHLFCQIMEKYDTTFIVVTHDKRIAERADRVLEIRDGKINEDKKGLARCADLVKI